MKYIRGVWILIKRYGIAFFCGGTVLMLLNVFVMKGIDASFVSACMDFALVVFAILTLLEARKIWLSKARDDGYKIALNLLNYQFIDAVTVSDLDGWINETEAIVRCYKSLDGRDNNLSQPEIIRAKECYTTKLDSQRKFLIGILEKDIYPLCKESRFSIFRMNNTGTGFSSGRQGEMLKESFDCFYSLADSCRDCSAMIDSFINLNKNESGLFEINDNQVRVTAYINALERSIDIIKGKCGVMSTNLKLATSWKESTILDYFYFK